VTLASDDPQPAVKDEDSSHPIASAWRPALREVVRAFVQGDYALARGVPGVAPVNASTVDQMQRYVVSYGETLAELPEETWETSVAQWMGTHWDVLVDLWTIESGPSDMVLSARVTETEGSFRIEVGPLYVP
jgi:hypothetical protein